MQSRLSKLLFIMILLLGIVDIAAATGESITSGQQDEPANPTQMAVVREGNIWLIDLRGATADQQITSLGLDCCLKWSPDGQILYYAREVERWTRYEIYMYSFNTGIETRLDLPGDNIQSYFDISPDGTQISYVSSREISSQPNEALLLGIESCLRTYELDQGSFTERKCFRDFTINEMDYSPSGNQLALSLGGFEYAEIGTYIFNGDYYIPVGCCWDPLFTFEGGEFLVTGSSYFLGELRNGPGSFGVFQLRVVPETFNLIFSSSSPINLAALSEDQTKLLYSEDANVKVYDFSTQASTIITAGSWPAWRPPFFIELPSQYEEWIQQKEEQISYLEEPPFEAFFLTFSLPDLSEARQWGYDEKGAEELVGTLKADLEEFENNTLSENEIEQLIAEAEAFGRLTLTERTLIDLHPFFSQTAYAISDSSVNLISAVMGIVNGIKNASEKIAIDNNPFSEPMIKLLRKAERKAFEFADTFLRVMVNTTEDPQLQQELKLMWDQIYRAVQLKFDEELDTQTALLDILGDTAFKSSVAAGILYWNFDKTQDLIDDGVNRVNSAEPLNPNISGSFDEADRFTQELVIDATFYSDYMAQQHNSFGEAYEAMELTASIGFFSSALIGFYGKVIEYTSYIFGGLTSAWDGACQIQHIQYLQDTAEIAHLYGFDTAQAPLTQFPTHCDFTRGTQIDSPEIYVAGADLFPVPSFGETKVPFAQGEAGDSIEALQTALLDIRVPVRNGDIEALEPLLNILIEQEEEISVETKVALSSISSTSPLEQVVMLQDAIADFDLQSAVLYLTFVSFYSAPENEEIQNLLLDQIDRLDQSLHVLAEAPTFTLPENASLDSRGTKLLIANVQGPAWVTENEASSLSIEIVNTGQTDTLSSLTLVDGETSLAMTELFTTEADDHITVRVDIPGLQTGDYLFFLQLKDVDDGLLESTPVRVEVLAPDVSMILSAGSGFVEQNPELPNGGENSDLVNEENSSIQPILIGIGILGFIVGLAISLLLLKQSRKLASGLSLLTGVVLAAVFISMGWGTVKETEEELLATPSASTVMPEISFVSFQSIEVDIAETAAALQAFVPTNVPTPAPSPEPTVLPTPTFVSQGEKIVIGESVNGQRIEAVKFGNGPDVVLLVGGIHAGFAPSSIELPRQLIEHYTLNFLDIPENITLFIIPTMNPDSVMAPGLFAGRVNSNGVDLNRNWDCRWAENTDVLGETRVGAGGSSPLSEPETQALSGFVDIQKPKLIIFFEARATNGYVVPGGCQERHLPSETFAMVYANEADYRLADFNEVVSDTLNGDASNYFAARDIPAIFVILPDYETVNLNENVAGLTGIFEQMRASR